MKTKYLSFIILVVSMLFYTSIEAQVDQQKKDTVPPKLLKIETPENDYEQEADKTADQVMRQAKASESSDTEAPKLPPLPKDPESENPELPQLLIDPYANQHANLNEELNNDDDQLMRALNEALSTSKIDISYTLELVPQLSEMSCWAAAAAMIVGWRDAVCINPEEIVEGIGYWGQFFYENGLPPDNESMFDYWGLTLLYPQSYTVEGFAQILNNGPLWVATDLNGGGHAVVIAGMKGDGTAEGTMLTIYDPWEKGMLLYRSSNTGAIYQQTYEEFIETQELLANREIDIPNAFYVAY